MTLVLDIDLARPLTKDEQRQVQALAISLAARPLDPSANQPLSEANIEAASRIMQRLGTDKSGVELAHESNDIRAEKYEKHFK